LNSAHERINFPERR